VTASALVGKAGEMLVSAELMRRGIEVASPASDVGVDLLAYRLETGQRTASRFVPIQVKARSGTGYNFQRSWFHRAPGLVLVQVWHVVTVPEFYVFSDIADVEEALGMHAQSPSWTDNGGYSVTDPSRRQREMMQPHRDRWERITCQL
jgi:hypothetical protein